MTEHLLEGSLSFICKYSALHCVSLVLKWIRAECFFIKGMQLSSDCIRSKLTNVFALSSRGAVCVHAYELLYQKSKLLSVKQVHAGLGLPNSVAQLNHLKQIHNRLCIFYKICAVYDLLLCLTLL